jgi:hypothetical protein
VQDGKIGEDGIEGEINLSTLYVAAIFTKLWLIVGSQIQGPGSIANGMRTTSIQDDDEARYFRRITLFFQAISGQIEDQQSTGCFVNPLFQSADGLLNVVDALGYLDAVKAQLPAQEQHLQRLSGYFSGR